MHHRKGGMSVATGPFCACLGCRDEAVKVIDHPEHGRRVVCEDCAATFEVMADV